jgi:hypothetical protein
MALARHLNTAPDRLQANMALGNAAVALGTDAATLDSSAIPIAHGGIVTTLAAMNETALSALAGSDLPTVSINGASATNPWVQPRGVAGFYTQPAATTVYYVIGAIAAGTVKVVQGTYDNQDLTNASGYVGKGKSVIPDVPDGFTPFCVIKIVTVASTFVPATTALTSISTIKNVNVLPVASTF